MGYISYGFMGNRKKTQELHFLSLEHLFDMVTYVCAYEKKQFSLTVKVKTTPPSPESMF